MGIKYKIIHFNINDLGVDINSVKNALSFKSLAWDTNDIKISQLKFLARKFYNDKPVIFQEAQRYLDDRTPPPNIKNSYCCYLKKIGKLFTPINHLEKEALADSLLNPSTINGKSVMLKALN